MQKYALIIKLESFSENNCIFDLNISFYVEKYP